MIDQLVLWRGKPLTVRCHQCGETAERPRARWLPAGWRRLAGRPACPQCVIE